MTDIDPVDPYDREKYWNDKAKERRTYALLALIAFGVLLTILGLGIKWFKDNSEPFDPQQFATLQAQRNSSDIDMGKLPSDLCLKDGKPVVLSSNIQTASRIGVSLSYISNKGELVTQFYIDGELYRTFRWSGYPCEKSSNANE